MPDEVYQRPVKEIYGDVLVAGELRWLAIRREKQAFLAEARRLWPEEKNVGKLLRLYCIKKGERNIPLITRRARMVDSGVRNAQVKRRDDLIRRLTEKFGKVSILNPDAMTEQEKEAYLRRHSEISKELPVIPCLDLKCDGMMTIGPICGSCKEARGEKPGVRYRTKWICEKCGYSEKSTKSLGAWAKKLGKGSKVGVGGQDGS